MTEEKKEEFKRKLSGEPVNWKEYAMWQTHLFCEAEMREKEFCWESRWWMNAEKRMHKAMGITEEESEAISEEYMKWLEREDKL